MSMRCVANILEFKDVLISHSIHTLIQSLCPSQCCDPMHCRKGNPLLLSIQPKIPKFTKRGSNGTKISWKRCQKIWKLLEFPKSEPFNRNFREFQDENFLENSFGKFGHASGGFCPHFRKLYKQKCNLSFSTLV